MKKMNETEYCQRKECGFETEIPSARYCAQDGSVLADEPYKSDFRRTVEVIGRDVLDKTGRVAKTVGSAGLKAVLYPVAGNLSGNLQETLEDVLGYETYDAMTTMTTSFYMNSLAIYPIAAGLIGSHYDKSAICSALVGSLAGWIEKPFRRRFNDDGFVIASLVGKIISLPIEAGLKIYDSARNYLGNCKKRAQEKVQEERR